MCDTAQLVNILELVVTRMDNEAQAQLQALHQQPGFRYALLSIVLETSVAFPIRQMASVVFKNSLFPFWKRRQPEFAVCDSIALFHTLSPAQLYDPDIPDLTPCLLYIQAEKASIRETLLHSLGEYSLNNLIMYLPN